MYSKTRTKLGIIYESCKLSEHLIASLAKVEQSLAVRHIAEYVYCLAPAVFYISTHIYDSTLSFIFTHIRISYPHISFKETSPSESIV